MKKFIGVFCFIVFWQITSMFIQRNIYPSFFGVMVTLFSNIIVILIHLSASSLRLLIGVFWAVILGMPIGIMIGYHVKLSEFLSPVIYLLAPIPKIALLPLIMLVFGIGNVSKIFIIFIIMFFQVVIAAHDSVKNIPKEYFIPLRTIKARNRSILINIVFPAAIPEMFTSVRIGLATGISVLFFAETFGTTYGLGYYVMDMWMRLNYKQMYAGILMLGFLGLISVLSVNKLQKRICPWQRKENT